MWSYHKEALILQETVLPEGYTVCLFFAAFHRLFQVVSYACYIIGDFHNTVN